MGNESFDICHHCSLLPRSCGVPVTKGTLEVVTDSDIAFSTKLRSQATVALG